MDFIFEQENVLSKEFCDEFIEIFESHRGVTQGVTSAGVMPDKKRSQDLTLDAFDDLKNIRQRLLDALLEPFTDYFVKYPFVGSINPVLQDNMTGVKTELTMDNIEQLDRNVLRMLIPRVLRSGVINMHKYNPGTDGYTHWHSEIYPDTDFEGLHRMVFWICYLNDVDEGGETEFFFQQRRTRPIKGKMIIAPAGFTHTHRGNIPLSNEKYILTSWLLYNRAGGI